MVLSAVTLPFEHCNPKLQKYRKQRHLTTRYRWLRKRERSMWSLFTFISVLMGQTPHTVYAIPGSNHAIMPESSKDPVRKQNYVDTVVKNISGNHLGTILTASDHVSNQPQHSDKKTQCYPRCFIVDTDSISFIIDTGANWFIVNDARLMNNYKPSNTRVKCISGDPAIASGTSYINLKMQSDDGEVVRINKLPVVHVESCLYNFFPPQLLIKETKQNNF